MFGYDDITGPSVAWFMGDSFERLCYEMLWFEVGERHPGGDVGGKPREYAPDGGIDLVVKRVGVPSTSGPDFRDALTHDDAPQRECVNCKSGHSWKEKLLENALLQPAPLDFVSAGERFSPFVHVEIGQLEKERLEIHLSNILGCRLENLSRTATRKRLATEARIGLTREQRASGVQNLLPGRASQIRSLIRVKCADDIWRFLRRHRPPLSAALRTLLRLREPAHLIEFGAWVTRHAEERMRTTIVYDDEREQCRQALLGALADKNISVVWVHGPPGIGKTKLVLEAISLAGREPQVVYAANASAAAAEMRIVAEFTGVVLVADDVSPPAVARLVAEFRSRATTQRRPTLIVVGPPRRADFESPEQVSEVVVGKLRDSAILEILRGELTVGLSDEEQERVLYLSKGSPWFALLLARAVYRFPGHSRVPSKPWEAALLALAGRMAQAEPEHAWEGRALALATSLLPVLVFSGMTLNQVERKYGVTKLGVAFGEDWQVLRKAIEECRQRGIVRIDQGVLSYVSPGVLAQIVMTKLLDEQDGRGPFIADAFPDEVEGFRGRLLELDVPENVVGTVDSDGP